MQKRKATKVANSLVKSAALKPKAALAESFDLIMASRLARQLDIDSSTLWRWRRLPDFPTPRHIRKHVYFSTSEVLAWIERQQQVA